MTNLSLKTTEKELRVIFSPFGTIINARIFIDCYTMQKRDFGYVTMSTRSEGRKAIKGLHGKAVHNRLLTVKELGT